MSDKLKVSKVESKGYGNIYKLPMMDRDLDVVAKAFYAYLCSFAGQGETAFPGIEKICYDLNISKSRLERHRKTLIDKGYITVNQVKENGRFARNEYHINKELIPNTQNEPTENEPTEFTCTENEAPHFDGINNNSINNNSINNNTINKKNNTPSEFDALLELYNSIEQLPKYRALSDKRKSHIKARIKEYGWQDCKDVLIKASLSKFLTDKNNGWFTIDWIFNPTNFLKILEGAYDNKQKNNRYNPYGALESEIEAYKREVLNNDDRRTTIAIPENVDPLF